MLQSLLADRFKLVAHKDTKPLPAYALVVGKKPQLKEADGHGQYRVQTADFDAPPGEGGIRHDDEHFEWSRRQASRWDPA